MPSINDFRSRMNQSAPSRFEVIINKNSLVSADLGNGTIGSSGELTSNLDLRYKIFEVSLPSSVLVTLPWRDNPGPVRNIAVDRSYEDISMQIYCTERYPEHTYFKTWHDQIYRKEQGNPQFTRVAYYEEYAGSQVVINKYNMQDNIEWQYTFYDAYPTAVGNVNLSWELANQISTFNVGFTYHYYLKTQ